jgi:serine/threonine protein kinase
MSITVQEIRRWLERKFMDFSVSDHLVGTYGLVWFLTHKSFPETKFAVKTVNPEKRPKLGQDMVENLRREFRIWLELPCTYNVLAANGIDIGTFSDGERKEKIKLPFMRMPVAEGSLKDWIETLADYPEADRLLALAQALNGLQYLYDHGIEAHSDLKPENLLYDNVRSKFRLDDQPTWPSIKHPWRIRVADLGWANAYKELGQSTTALREYSAPERLGEQE